jgi:hypothetical protein
MKTMREYAYEYEMKHKNKGMVIALEDYRFLFVEKPDKNGKSNSYWVMLSWFLDL